MRLVQIFFSPTGGTKKVLDIISSVWDCEKTEIDLSDPNRDFSNIMTRESDLCLIAVPSFGGRVPGVALSRLSKIRGNGASAVVIAVFGNRAIDDTLLELKNTLGSLSFRCVAAVSAAAEHSIMHQFGAGRPDKDDERQLLTFARKIKEALGQNTAPGLTVPGHFPYREYHGVPFRPKAGKSCTRCGLCARECPVGAIPEDSPCGTIEEKCVSCMRCISACPRHARALNKAMLFAASQKMKKECAERKENELFISYTEAGRGAF